MVSVKVNSFIESSYLFCSVEHMGSSTNSASRFEREVAHINQGQGDDFSTSFADGSPTRSPSSPAAIGQSATVSPSQSENLFRDASTTVPENVLRRNLDSNTERAPVDPLRTHAEEILPEDIRVEGETPSAECPQRKIVSARESSCVTIDEQMSRCTISATNLITFLPELTAVELSYIGQSVSLQTQTSSEDNGEESEWMCYEGLICMVTSSCISLMDARRFTLSDYNTFVAQKAQVDAEEQLRNDPFLNPSLPFLSTPEVNHHRGRTPSPVSHPFVPECQVLPAERQFTRKAVTMGPFPFITVVRKAIRDVKVIPTPSRSSFIIFSDPEKKIVDMQYLRIIIRRYLVQSSLKKNSACSDLTLQKYIACRCNAINIDVALLETVAKEELRFLLEVNEKISISHGHSFRGRGELELFYDDDTGRDILVSTGLPHFTVNFVVVSAMIMLFGLFYSLFFLFCVQKSPLVGQFVEKDWLYYFLGFFMAAPAFIVIAYHAVFMAPPWRSQLTYSAFRLTLTVASLIVFFVCIAKLANRCRDSTGFDFFTTVSDEGKVCQFYFELGCAGWSYPNRTHLTEECPLVPYYPQNCRQSLMFKMRLIALPVLAVQVAVCVLLSISIGLLVVMFYYIREIFYRRLVFRQIPA